MSAAKPAADEAVVVAYARTPIGRAGKGSLAAERPDDLLAFALAEALAQVPQLAPDALDEVLVGCGYPQQQQGTNVARRASLLAGLPVSVPAATVSRFCASGLLAIRSAFHAIAAGEGSAFLVGGVESVSTVDRTPGEHDRHPRLTGADPQLPDVYVSMGVTAENVAQRYDVGREQMDRYAQHSQEKANRAVSAGFFEREISPYRTAAGELVAADDGPRPSSTYEALSQLRPVFAEDGAVTAGNSCPLNDGAAAALIVSAELAAGLGVEPIARLVATATTALDPAYMGMGPLSSIQLALDRAEMSIADADVIEINEAFAAQVIPVCEGLGIDAFDERLNPHGGAIALGHPFGMTGVRMLGTLLNGLEQRDGRIGIESMCVAQGQGMALIVERAG